MEQCNTECCIHANNRWLLRSVCRLQCRPQLSFPDAHSVHSCWLWPSSRVILTAHRMSAHSSSTSSHTVLQQLQKSYPARLLALLNVVQIWFKADVHLEKKPHLVSGYCFQISVGQHMLINSISYQFIHFIIVIYNVCLIYVPTLLISKQAYFDYQSFHFTF